ncbi:hypothetical protein F0726_01921 [Acidithiobacillus caldus]|nr:hypothetical protein F0726_01921 [Acidithiobacillus caldus]
MLRAGLGGELRSYQKAGVEFITQHAKGKAYVGDEMGLGKTITALAAIHQEQAYPALVVCPAVVVGNWKQEAEKWLPQKSVQIIKSGKDTVDPKADIVIASYALAGVAKGHKFQQIVCDEAHYLKNPKSQRTKTVAEIAKATPRRLLLSGTPVTNKPKDIFSQLEIVDVAGKGKPFGTFFTFATQYCGGHEGRFGFEADGATNIEELNQRLRDSVYLRRDKSQVLTELPEKQRQVLLVGIPPETRRRIKEIEKEYDRDKENRVRGAEIKAMTNEMVAVGMGKIDAASEYLEDFAETGKKLIVFANLREVQQALLDKARDMGIPHVHILGDDSAEDRTRAVRDFQEKPDVRFAICSLKAAGVGVTLTAASDVLMVEQDWTPANLDQAEDRAHRMGQKNAVNVVYLVMQGTIDQQLSQVIENKRKISADLSQPVMDEVLERWRPQSKEKRKDRQPTALEIV